MELGFEVDFFFLEKEMPTHSSILAWKIPWTEDPGRLQSMGWQRVRHDWATSLSLFFSYSYSVLNCCSFVLRKDNDHISSWKKKSEFHRSWPYDIRRKYNWNWRPVSWSIEYHYCWRTLQHYVLEKTLESSLDFKEIKPVNPKGNQSWIFIGRTDADAEAPVFWPPDAKNWLTGKDPDGKDLKQEE